jgi:hypothetical protein
VLLAAAPMIASGTATALPAARVHASMSALGAPTAAWAATASTATALGFATWLLSLFWTAHSR